MTLVCEGAPRSARSLLAGVLALVAGATAPASAQWTVTSLHPPKASWSEAFAIADGRQAGYAIIGSTDSASVWTGTAASWVNLHPAQALGSYAMGASGGTQVGFVALDDAFHASMWNGSAASWTDLHPAGSFASYAYAVAGAQQVGIADLGGPHSPVFHAGTWNGSAASWVDLHPAGAAFSVAWGAAANQQVGFVALGGTYHASMWNNTAASWVDLHPAGSTRSQANATSGAQQVGYATVDAVHRAALWTGSAPSWVDLHPAVATQSDAYGVFGGEQVGYARVGGVYRASLWGGTAASWVDLHAFLPAGYSSSYAQGIWADASGTYVVGEGFNDSTGTYEALLWSRPTLPVAPTILTATEPSPGVARITWRDNSPGETQFEFQRQSKPSNRWTGAVIVGSSPALAGTGATGSWDQSPGSGAWRYAVRAGNAAGTSAWTQYVVVKPAKPTGLSAMWVPGGAGHDVQLSWTDQSGFESTFKISRQHRVGTSWTETTAVGTGQIGANATIFTDTTIAAPGLYRYRIAASNNGGSSPWTGWIQITVP